MSDEPSVLDYVKSLLTPWRGKPLPIPQIERQAEEIAGETLASPQVEAPTESAEINLEVSAAVPPEAEGAAEAGPHIQERAVSVPWRPFAALILALAAQIALEPRPNRGWVLGAFLYLWAAGWAVWSSVRGEWTLAPIPDEIHKAKTDQVRLSALIVSAPLVLAAFLAFGGNVFDTLNVALWGLALGALFMGLWVGSPRISRMWMRLRDTLDYPINIKLSSWMLVLLLTAAVVVFFRVYRLAEVPLEMVSDHAEKLLDVGDVLNGQYSIYFPRNTGREAFQMYLTAGVARVFGSGLSFMSLKIGTTLAGLVTLVFVYLLGKEIANRWAGLFAALFAGMAYWGNVITRSSLRFTLYPLFVAPVLFYLIRGLRSRNRNDFLMAGLFLGVGLHGYSPFRIVPLVIVLGFVLYVLHRQSEGTRKRAFIWLAVLALVSLYVFLPLLRYALQEPQMFSYRTLTRMGTLERELPGPALEIFLRNLWDALVMFAWDNGEVWLVSVTHRPALDIVSAALFHMGVALLFLRYLRKRNWIDLYLLLSIPLLMLPSILSLAFPNENPILNRTAGAIVPVFLVVGLSFEGLLRGIKSTATSPWARRLAWGTGIFLIFWSAMHNYNLVFEEYQHSYEMSSWNTTELGKVVSDFGTIFGSTENAWVVAYPHWVDTRLVGVNAGEPGRDLGIWPENLAETTANAGPKLFMIKPEDENAIQILQELYPQGSLQVYDSRVDKDFLVYITLPTPGELFVPGEEAPH